MIARTGKSQSGGGPGWVDLLNLLACMRARMGAGQKGYAIIPVIKCWDWVTVLSRGATVPPGIRSGAGNMSGKRILGTSF